MQQHFMKFFMKKNKKQKLRLDKRTSFFHTVTCIKEKKHNWSQLLMAQFLDQYCLLCCRDRHYQQAQRS